MGCCIVNQYLKETLIRKDLRGDCGGMMYDLSAMSPKHTSSRTCGPCALELFSDEDNTVKGPRADPMATSIFIGGAGEVSDASVFFVMIILEGRRTIFIPIY